MVSDATAAPSVRALACPSCGAAIALRTFGQAESVACGHCGSVLDARDPSLRVLEQARRAQRVTPLIPLGTRGTLHGDPWEVVGFQVRAIVVEGLEYAWREYVLFNPYKGFRYLTEYDGHWNDVVVLKTLPELGRRGGRPVATVLGETFRHFQTATARTRYVVGEFPWRVRRDDRAVVRDYVAPPRMLSAEESEGEITWSMGTYTPGREIWRHFGLPGSPPAPRGVYANQPSPHAGRLGWLWKLWALFMVLLVLVAMLNALLARNELVLRSYHRWDPRSGSDGAFVTEPFTLEGRTSNVEVALETDLDQSWIYVAFTLIDERTGRTWDFGRSVSYYHGRDSDGRWTEGRRTDRARIPSVPPGRYLLRVAHEGDPTGRLVNYTLSVRRDVPAPSHYLVAVVLLLVPPVWGTLRAATFESRRWSESDYAPSSDDEDDD